MTTNPDRPAQGNPATSAETPRASSPTADARFKDYIPVIAWNDGLVVGNTVIYGIGFNKKTQNPMMLTRTAVDHAFATRGDIVLSEDLP